jgi:hypothetical protein
MTNSPDSSRTEELLQEALHLVPADRAKVLDQLQTKDEALQVELNTLLSHLVAAEKLSYLGSPLFAPPVDQSDVLPDSIGDYEDERSKGPTSPPMPIHWTREPPPCPESSLAGTTLRLYQNGTRSELASFRRHVRGQLHLPHRGPQRTRVLRS